MRQTDIIFIDVETSGPLNQKYQQNFDIINTSHDKSGNHKAYKVPTHEIIELAIMVGNNKGIIVPVFHKRFKP